MVTVFPSSSCSLTTSSPAVYNRPETMVHVGSKTSHFTYSSGLNQNYIQVDLCTPRFSVPSRPADLQDDWMTLAVTLSRKQIDLWAICN
ncbi:hypothetical protein SRHO_G00327950 [Serrasalmus rhombeus]